MAPSILAINGELAAECDFSVNSARETALQSGISRAAKICHGIITHVPLQVEALRGQEPRCGPPFKTALDMQAGIQSELNNGMMNQDAFKSPCCTPPLAI